MPTSFKRWWFFVVVFLFVISADAQKRMLSSLDSMLVQQNRFISEMTLEEFIASELANSLIDLRNFDEELLEAAIFFNVNTWRIDKRKVPFRIHSKLDRVAAKYVTYYKKYRFKNQANSYLRLIRTMRNVPKYYPLDFSYLDGFVGLMPLIDYEKGPVYYNIEFQTSPVNFYAGNYQRNDDFKEEPLEQITYQELADRYFNKVLRSRSSALIRSKAYELFTVKVAEVQRNSNKKALPKVKITCLMGAYRNKYILEEFQSED